MGESFTVEGKQSYSGLNFRGGRKCGDTCLKYLALHVLYIGHTHSNANDFVHAFRLQQQTLLNVCGSMYN